MTDSLLISTGYATITRNIIKRFAKIPDFKCTHFGWQFIGNPTFFRPDDTIGNNTFGAIRLLPNRGTHHFGGDLLQNYIRLVQPDITFILADTFMLHDWIYNIDFSPSKFIMYFPSDGTPLPARCENVLKKANIPVAMSKYAQEEAKKYYNIDTKYIPHAVDTKFYHPISEQEKQRLRVKWSKKWGIDLMNKFIVLSVGRNQGRKALPELIKCIGKFSKNKKDVLFLIHADPEDPAGISPHWTLMDILQRNKIDHITRFTGTRVWFQFPKEDYREVFQLADIHALATTGEGWGIPTIEAMACGIPNIITDFTTTEEIIKRDGCGLAIPLTTTITGTWAVERGFVDKDKFVEGLELLYKDKDLREKFGKKGREKVTKEYDWDVVFPLWKKLFYETLK